MRQTSVRRLLCAWAVLATLMAGAAPATAGAAPDSPAPSAAAPAPLILKAPRRVEVDSGYGPTVTDFGLQVVAQGEPFEIWSTRSGYDQRIRSVWRSSRGNVELPAGSMRSFRGLAKFVRVRARPVGGGPVRRLALNACFGEGQRVQPEASAESPYPTACWANAYSLGSVMGVQEGWASPVGNATSPRLAPGTYRVRARIASRYSAILGLSRAEASVRLRLVVRRGALEDAHDDSDGAAGASPYRAAAEEPSGRQIAPAGGPVPDLRSLPAWDVGLDGNSERLRFAATVWNAGTSPLVVDGFRDRRNRMTAYQYFYDQDGDQTGYQQVGFMHWDRKPSHRHWHFKDFARYTLLDAQQREVGRSSKESFCLANTDAVDLTRPSAEWQPELTSLDTACGGRSALSIRQVLAAGWGDTYTQARGQSLDISGLPNGIYYIATIANPEGNLVESDATNNVSLRRIKIGGRPGHRTVKVPQVGIVREFYAGLG